MGLTLEKVLLVSDVVDCVDMYYTLNDFTFLPASKKKAVAELSQAVRLNRFVRMAKYDGALVGWIYAAEANIGHMQEKVLQQMYYASNQSGIKAVRTITFLHNAMLEYAENKGYQIVLSAGSHMDPSGVFVRTLAKNGWDTRGYLAAKKTSHYKDNECQELKSQTQPKA